MRDIMWLQSAQFITVHKVKYKVFKTFSNNSQLLFIRRSQNFQILVSKLLLLSPIIIRKDHWGRINKKTSQNNIYGYRSKIVMNKLNRNGRSNYSVAKSVEYSIPVSRSTLRTRDISYWQPVDVHYILYALSFFL